MDLRQMRVLQAVIAAGSTSGAAETLNVSQPAVSKTIKQIEDEIQMPLFERAGGRIRPTSQALAILPDINRMLSGQDMMKQRIEEVRQGRKGIIKVAAASMAASGLLPGAIVRHRAKHPHVGFSIMTTTTKEVIRLVSDNEVDIGVCRTGPGYPSISSRTLSSSMIVCAMPQDHPLAQLEVVTAADLIFYPLIVADFHEPGLGNRIADTFISQGFFPPTPMSSNLSVTSFALARAGLGVAIADSFTVPLEGITTRPYRPRIDLTVQAIFPADRPPSPLVSTFADDLAEYAEELEKRLPSL